MLKLTGLWQNESDGKTYLTGYLGDLRLVVFPNNYKEKENQPDFIMYVDEKKKPEGNKEENKSESKTVLPF